MGQPEYDEFDLQLDRVGDGFTVRVVDSPVGPTSAVPFQLPGSADTLKLLVLTLRAVRGVRALETDTAPDAKKYGGELFDAVFHGDTLSALRGSLHVASTTNRGLRLRLRFADPSVLANVPWELLYDTTRRRFLCQYGKYPVVRYLEVPEPVTPLRVTGPVRMLVVISAPRDYPEVHAEKEWTQLSTVLEPLVGSRRLQVDRLPSASLAAIHQALLDEEYHVFHYIGHGGVDSRTGDGVLALTGRDGLSRLESGHDLGVMLSNAPIRLAVLNSCDGARISDVDPYAGTAVSLVEQGIPAVVAMQFEISDEAAFAFSGSLYNSITAGRPVDLAVTLARQAILATSRSEWATPVLYMRASEGVIFDLSGSAAAAVDPADMAAAMEAAVGAAVAVGATETATPAVVPVTPSTARDASSTAGEEPPTVDRPPPLPAPPAAPTGLTATVVGGREVDLTWEMPEEGAPAASWELRRDGSAAQRSVVPTGRDVVPRSGTYVYTVVALDARGGRSPESDPCTVVVEQPKPRTTGPVKTLAAPGVAAPPTPELLTASVRGRDVRLEWDREDAGEAVPPVAHWQVTRDGKPISRVVGEPRTVDKRPGKGRHTYAVTAIGPGGARSRPSDALVVRVGGTSPAWLALLLVPLLVVLGWYAVSRDGGGTARPATPSAPTADVVGLTVKLSWERPSSSTPQVREWRVLRDEQFVNTAPRPPYSDTVDKPGTYSYSLVAVGTDGQLSDPSAARTVTVSTEPTKIRADLRVSATQNDADPDLVRVRVFNDGPDRADQVSVTVRASVPGAVKNVTMGQGVPCSPQAGVRVCGVDWINPHKPLAIVVHLDRSHAPFTVTASAQSRVVDPKSSNNRDTVLISGESKTSTTTTTSPNGMTQTTGTTTTAGPG